MRQDKGDGQMQSSPPAPAATRRSFAARIATAPLWLIVSIVALLARGVTFGDPVVHVDEEFYFFTAHAMWHGALPFVDVWDRKPIGLFLLYMPAAALPLPWGIYAYQAMAIAFLVLTALLVARLARAAGWARGALPAAIAYVLWPNLLNGVGGQSPILYNLPMAAAAMLILAGEGNRRRRVLGFGAMALVGIALQIKYSVVFEGVFFGLWQMWREWSARRSVAAILAYGAGLATVALLPTLAAFGIYALLGHADAFFFANFASVSHRNTDPLPEMLGNIGTLFGLLLPLIAIAWIGRRAVPEGGSAVARRFLFLWFGIALFAIAIFGTWFDHYGLPALVPGCACAAGFFATPRFRRRAMPAILALVALGGQVMVLLNIHGRGNAAQFATLAAAVGRGPGCLYVYSGSTMLYVATDRCRLSRYIVPAHINRARENGATGIDQAAELRRILALRPDTVVMRPPFRGERPDIHAIAVQAMARDGYRRTALLPMGNERIAVFKR